MTGPTMLTPNGKGCGAGNFCSSSRKIYCRIGSQPVPPYSFGQWATAQPLSLSVRVHRRRSSLSMCSPSTSLRARLGGKVIAKEGAHLLAEGGFLGREAQVHGFLLNKAPSSGASRHLLPVGEKRKRRRLRPPRPNGERSAERSGGRVRGHFSPQLISNSPAAPMPPPMHMVTTAYLTPRRLPSISAWPASREPLMP